MLMVDELQRWPTRIACFRDGSCHLTTDGSIDELHAFAQRIGLKREWFQDHGLVPHYDLTPRMRERALQTGARFVPAKMQAWARRQMR